jgi:hypothetical protein
MRRYSPGRLSFILSGFILFLCSCVPQSCIEETEAYLKASFYDNVSKKILAPDSITVYGLNMDTAKLYNKATKVQPALFPLNSSSSKCIYVIKINGVTDTVEFRYSSYPHLLSKECGYTFFHHLDTEPRNTYHAIKNIYTGNSSITTSNVENIRIFY